MVSRFLLVSLIMDAVLEDATIHQRSQTLYKMTKGFGLDDAYSTTLDRIREQRGNRARLGMEALMWISCSVRPLKAEELCHALAVEVGATDLNVQNVPSIQTLLGCTLGLMTIEEQNSTVRLVHFTLQEYLDSHLTFFTKAQSMMAEICLTYLNFQSIGELSPTLDSIPQTTPFLFYASCYWGFHARNDVTEGVKQLALGLLQRDANHISAAILLREKSVDFLSGWERYRGIHPDSTGFTGLHCIAYMGITEIAVAMLEKRGWDLNGRDSKGATPLIWAVKHGNLMLAKLLLEQGNVDPLLSDRDGLTSLAHAASVGDHHLVKLLLQRVDINPDSVDVGGRTPLSYAAGSGHEDVVKILLQRCDVNPDSLDNGGRTPLSYAAEDGKEGAVKILLELRDVNPDSSDIYGRTPLALAAKSGQVRIVKILLELGDVNPDPSDEDGRTPLSYAAKYGKEGVVKILLERQGVNPDSLDKDGWTPLSYAATFGQEGVVKLLLERRDVNPDSSNKYGCTPLSCAAGSGHEGIVKILLERGDVNPGSSDNGGRTPLSYAAGSGHEGVVKILLKRRDVNPDLWNNYGRTTLDNVEQSSDIGAVGPLSEPRSPSLKASQTCGLTPKVSSPSPSTQEEVEPGSVSQQEVIIPDIINGITETTPLPLPAMPPPNHLQGHTPGPTPEPIPTSIPIPVPTPDSTVCKHSRPPKSCIAAVCHIFRHFKRKLFPPS